MRHLENLELGCLVVYRVHQAGQLLLACLLFWGLRSRLQNRTKRQREGKRQKVSHFQGEARSILAKEHEVAQEQEPQVLAVGGVRGMTRTGTRCQSSRHSSKVCASASDPLVEACWSVQFQFQHFSDGGEHLAKKRISLGITQDGKILARLELFLLV